MTPREVIRGTAKRFQAAGVPDPDNDASVLLSHLTGKHALELRMDSDSELPDDTLSAYSVLVEKRLNRTPLQYLLGKAPFYSRFFKVDPRVLIPRPETELLCEWALDILDGTASPRILDLCCGSGCIGLTLKAERPDSLVTLSDLSSEALDVAESNASLLSLDVTIRQSDLLNSLHNSFFDLIVSNPPYIPSADCRFLQPEVLKEPLLALDGGSDGCDLYRRIIHDAGSVLVPGGRLLMELGINEAGLIVDLLDSHGYSEIQLHKDYAGIDRMILAVFPGRRKYVQ